jgi:hypothetical protein
MSVFPPVVPDPIFNLRAAVLFRDDSEFLGSGAMERTGSFRASETGWQIA